MYFELLKEWCDTLLKLQVTDIKRKEIYGGIMCPSCARIHGRCGDAIYPLMFLAARTGESKYVEAAKLLFDWTEHKMVLADGSYRNDTNSDWRGITVFAVIQLGEALKYHSDLLDSETRGRWFKRFQISADYLHDNIDRIGGNINYPVTCAAAMALAYKLLCEEKYAQKARQLAREALQYFTEDGLLYGEGKPMEGISPKGCRPVDLGYNVEESLPGLVTYALYMEDQELLTLVSKAMETHLQFMLPDGAWDNSWGTRNNKWSYWGSRTSDGCQAGYGLLADQYPLFAEAVYRNTLLLKECTHDGLLHGGPMFHTAKEAPCVHHTFCHAKAIAIMLEHGIEPGPSSSLPRDKAQGVTYFPSIHVSLAAKANWRMTVSDYDVEYSEEGHATGGAITLLWNKACGPILAGTMSSYYLVEPNNMQLPRHTGNICLTARIELCREEEYHGSKKPVSVQRYYRSINDKAAAVEYQEGDKISYQIRGKLVDGKQDGDMPYELNYELSDTELIIRGSTSASGARFYLPIISPSGNGVEAGPGNCYRIETVKGSLMLEAASQIRILGDRIFNPVGGFEAVPFYLELQADTEFWIKLRVMEAK